MDAKATRDLLIFDLDGTLIDSKRDLSDSVNATRASLGLPPLSDELVFSYVGAGASVNWPVGLGGKGNEGVTGLIKQTPGSIGYVELIYALQTGTPFGKVQNAGGKFVKADLAGVVGFPVLEAPCIRAHRVAAGPGPCRRVQVEEGRLEPVKHRLTHVQETGTARSSQEMK